MFLCVSNSLEREEHVVALCGLRAILQVFYVVNKNKYIVRAIIRLEGPYISKYYISPGLTLPVGAGS